MNSINFICSTALVICTCLGSLAQSGDTRKRTITVNEQSYTRHFTIIDKEKTLIVSVKKDYRWYKSNKVLSTRGGQGGRLLHGKYTEYFLNKSLKTSGKHRKGLQRGKWKHWHPNGMIKSRCRYFFGHKWGKEIVYDTTGAVVERRKFRRGHQWGRTKIYESETLVAIVRYRKGVPVRRKLLNASKNKASANGDEEQGSSDSSLAPKSKAAIKNEIKRLKRITNQPKQPLEPLPGNAPN